MIEVQAMHGIESPALDSWAWIAQARAAARRAVAPATPPAEATAEPAAELAVTALERPPGSAAE